MLLRCWCGGVGWGGVGWGGGSLCSKRDLLDRCVQKAKIFSCMSSAGNGDMSMDTVASSKRRSRRWNAWSDKGWKRVLHIFAKNPNETQIWPNLRAQIWPNLAYQTVRFAVAKIFFLKTCLLWARFLVRRDNYVYIFIYVSDNICRLARMNEWYEMKRNEMKWNEINEWIWSDNMCTITYMYLRADVHTCRHTDMHNHT